MRTLLYMINVFIFFAINSCKNHSTQTNIANNKKHDTSFRSIDTVGDKAGNRIDYEKTKVIETVYVIDRNGIDFKQQAEDNSETLGKYDYGTRLAVVELKGDWLGIRDRIIREFERNGSKIEVTAWEKVYIKKSSTGDLKTIQLNEKDLNIITSLTKQGKTETDENGIALNCCLRIELIGKSEYESKKKNFVTFLIQDTALIKKKSGKIILRCENKNKVFIDKPDAETEMIINDYVGKIEFVDKYLVKKTYYEGSGYTFVDKKTGEESKVFIEYPNISPDKKNIICISANPYSTTGDLEIYSINENKINLIFSACFKYWMPTIEREEIFWNNDGCFYVPVKHINAYWNESGNFNDKFQYIKIKIL